MRDVTMASAADLVRVIAGKVDPAKISLFSVMRNESAILPAFFDHYRRIGFQQFVILDDGSDDGSRAWLQAQPDCVLLEADMRFGDELRYCDPEGKARRIRFGTYAKIAVPHLYFDGQVVAYLDADEFLLLPPGVDDIAEVIAAMDRDGDANLMASVVEVFPAGVEGLSGELPQTADGLFSAYPYFQPQALFRPSAAKKPDFLAPSKTEQLFEHYGVTPPLVRSGWQRLWMSKAAKAEQLRQKSPRHKTPLIRRSANSRLTGSHGGNLPPAPDKLLVLAHFVFTAQFAAKIRRAVDWGSYAHGSRKYHGYARLLEALQAQQDGFLDGASARYEDPQQLIDCGLMLWPESAQKV